MATKTIPAGSSWQAAYASAAPGDILQLGRGAHGVQQLDRIPGRTGAPVVFRGGGGVEIAAINSGKGGGSVTSATGADRWSLEDVKVSGEIKLSWGSNFVTLVNVDAGNIRVTSCEDFLAQKCDFGPFVDQVATVNSAGGAPGVKRIRFEDCLFHDYTISNAEKHAECMQIWPSAASEEVQLVRCKFLNGTDFDVLVKAPALKNLLIKDCDWDVPMPGNRATVECCPECGDRWGSAIRLSSHIYTGAVIEGNIVKSPASIVVDNKPGVTLRDNVFVAELPAWPRTAPVPVPDTTPPTFITVPPDTFVAAASADGTAVEFEAKAIDDRGGPVTIVITPASGSVFPAGTDTTVKVEAADEAGNISTASFHVIVGEWVPVPPKGPLNLRKTGGSGNVATIEWDAVPGAIGYRHTRDGKIVSHTWDGTDTKTTVDSGATVGVETLMPGLNDEIDV